MADDAQHRLACEARTWLRKGYGTRDRLPELAALIVPKRGQAAFDRLTEEMRRQWSRRHTWDT